MKCITIYDQYQISVHVRSIPGGEHAGGMVCFSLNGMPRLTNSWLNRYTVIGFRGRVSRRGRSIQLTIARGNSRPAVKVRESGDRLNRCNSGTDGTVRMGENHSQARCALKRSLRAVPLEFGHCSPPCGAPWHARSCIAVQGAHGIDEIAPARRVS